MPVDYSKWDALELSDDSDVEVHPNVDKRSFIKAKQAKIHAERAERKHHIETLKYERIINEQLMSRISGLLNSLKSHADEAKASGNPGDVAFKSIFESTPKDPKDDMPPPPPEGVHKTQTDRPSYSKMMATLLDQVNKTLNEKKPTDRYQAMVDEIGEHLAKVQDLQKQLFAKLAELEEEEGKKITSESIHTGFDSSQVNKSKPSAASSSSTGKETKVELLNPSYTAPLENKTTADMVVADDDDEDVASKATPEAKHFALIAAGDFKTSFEYLSRNQSLLAETQSDALLIMAFDASLEKKPEVSRNYVHQALLLQYCRSLGRDGISLFFKRIMTPGHQAREVFFKDVQETYGKIKTRAGEIIAEQAQSGGGGVEQIQLHAVEPGTVINITIPPADSEDAEVQEARKVYEGFAPDMKAALETGELDKVNKVLGDMPVGEAEEMVAKFGEAGVLSLEEQVIDATTEEGKQHFEDLKAEKAREAAEEKKAEEAEREAAKMAEKYGDPE